VNLGINLDRGTLFKAITKDKERNLFASIITRLMVWQQEQLKEIREINQAQVRKEQDLQMQANAAAQQDQYARSALAAVMSGSGHMPPALEHQGQYRLPGMLPYHQPGVPPTIAYNSNATAFGSAHGYLPPAQPMGGASGPAMGGAQRDPYADSHQQYPRYGHQPQPHGQLNVLDTGAARLRKRKLSEPSMTITEVNAGDDESDGSSSDDGLAQQIAEQQAKIEQLQKAAKERAREAKKKAAKKAKKEAKRQQQLAQLADLQRIEEQLVKHEQAVHESDEAQVKQEGNPEGSSELDPSSPADEQQPNVADDAEEVEPAEQVAPAEEAEQTADYEQFVEAEADKDDQGEPVDYDDVNDQN
jgi:hypothetical protein